jgi:hypothetical protein
MVKFDVNYSEFSNHGVPASIDPFDQAAVRRSRKLFFVDRQLSPHRLFFCKGRISRLSQIVRKLFKCAVVALFKRPRRTQLVEELAFLRNFAEGLRAQRYCR